MAEPTQQRELDQTTVTLLRRAREGDAAAFDALCARYQPRLRRWAHGRLPAWARNGIDTEDLVQDALMRTMQRIDTFDPRHAGALQAYLHTILRNLITDAVRDHRRHPGAEPLAADQADPAPDPLQETIGRENYARYMRAMQRLDEDARGLIIMRFEWGFSHQEIALETGKPTADAARMAVCRALLKLNEEMSREG